MNPRSPAHSPAPPNSGKRLPHPATPTTTAVPAGPKDFSYLLRPEIYHPLTPSTLPAAFRNPPGQVAEDIPLQTLLSQGHFRAAAIAATAQLTNPDPATALRPTDHPTIFHLFYTRLACLTLLDATALAAQEVKALGDLHSAFYYAPSPTAPAQDGSVVQAQEHIVPWPLRVLAVRLQALGFGDPRRAVMSYYELAREARVKLGEAKGRHDFSGVEVWRERLVDLGVRVAGALVEMDDLTGAVEHLGTLEGGGGGGGMVRVRRALLWLHLGDVEAARGCVGEGEAGVEGVEERVVEALCDMADGEYEAALGKCECFLFYFFSF